MKIKDVMGDYTGQHYKGSNFDTNYKDNITSLEGSPLKVEENYYILRTSIKDLKGGPIEVVGVYNCDDSKELVSLEGGPSKCAIFSCEKCPKLKNELEQIIKYQIKADEYFTNTSHFTFKDIKKEFEAEQLKYKVQSKGFRTLLGLKNEI